MNKLVFLISLLIFSKLSYSWSFNDNENLTLSCIGDITFKLNDKSLTTKSFQKIFTFRNKKLENTYKECQEWNQDKISCLERSGNFNDETSISVNRITGEVYYVWNSTSKNGDKIDRNVQTFYGKCDKAKHRI